MNIFKKHKGIDLNAENSGLHGSVIIQFRDPITGKVMDEVKHDNFFTNALSDIYNKCPWGLNNTSLMGMGIMADNYNASQPATHENAVIGRIYENLLGGIALFPNSLGTGLDDYYPGLDANAPTAYASKDSYTISDTKQGSYNGVESGKLSNGFRYVYDWNTSQGNGPISAVALTHKKAYSYYNDGTIMLWPKVASNSPDTVRGYYGYVATASNFRGAVAMDDTGILCANGNVKIVNFYNICPYNFKLLANVHGYITTDETPMWTLDLSSYNGNPSYQFYNGFLYVIFKNAEGSNAAQILKINKATGEIISTDSITWQAPQLTSSTYHFAIKDGYVYAGATVAGKIYKLNLTNGTDVTEISCNAAIREALCTSDNTDNIYGTNILINNGVVVNHTTVNPNIKANTSNDANGMIMYQKGVWIVTASRPFNNFIGAQILTPYCATKNNLDEAKTKSTDKTMKVTYTVTQV